MVTYAYERRRPENTLLYEVIRDNAETFYAACEAEGAPLPGFVKREVEAYLGCGPLCRGTVRYSGCLGPASKLRPLIIKASPVPITPCCADNNDAVEDESAKKPKRGKANGAGTYRPWNELLRRTFLIDVLACPSCAARMKLLSLVTKPQSIIPYLRRIGLPTDIPQKSRPRPPAPRPCQGTPTQHPRRAPALPEALLSPTRFVQRLAGLFEFGHRLPGPSELFGVGYPIIPF